MVTQTNLQRISTILRNQLEILNTLKKTVEVANGLRIEEPGPRVAI